MKSRAQVESEGDKIASLTSASDTEENCIRVGGLSGGGE